MVKKIFVSQFLMTNFQIQTLHSRSIFKPLKFLKFTQDKKKRAFLALNFKYGSYSSPLEHLKQHKIHIDLDNKLFYVYFKLKFAV